MKNIIIVQLLLIPVFTFSQKVFKGTISKTYELTFEQSGKLKEGNVVVDGKTIEGLPSALKKDDTLKLIFNYSNDSTIYEKKQQAFLRKISKNYTELLKEQPAFACLFSTEFDFVHFRLKLMKEDKQLIKLVAPKEVDYIELEPQLNALPPPTPPLFLPLLSRNTFEINLTTFPSSAVPAPVIIPPSPLELLYPLSSNIDSLHFKILQVNKADSSILAHLNATKQYYNKWEGWQMEINAINEQFSIYTPIIDKLLYIDTLNNMSGEYNDNLADFLVQLIPYQNTLDMIVKKIISMNEEWIKRWLWYTGGNITLNPFRVFESINIEKRTTQTLKLLNDQKTALNFYITGNYQQDLAPFDEVEKKLKQINMVIDQLERFKASMPEKQKEYEKWLTGLKQKSKVLYEGRLLGASNKQIYWMQHYNATQKFEKWEIKKTPLPKYMAEIDANTVLIHNLAQQQKDSISMGILEKINIETPAEIALKPVSDALSTALNNTSIGTLLTGILPSLKGVTKETEEITQLSFNKEGFRDTLEKTNRNFINIMPNSDAALSFDYLQKYKLDPLLIQELIKRYRQSKELLEWLNTETLQMLSLPNVEAEADTKPAYRTAIHFPEKDLEDIGNAKVPYSVLVNQKAVATRTYKKYKLTHFLPLVTLLYIPDSRLTYTYDETTQQHNIVKELDQFDAMAGLKYYPFGINVGGGHKDKVVTKLEKCKGYAFRRGNSILNHTYLTFGISVRQKLLKNYFLGIGTDLFSGVGIQVGTNIFTQKSYDIENGKIINEYERFTDRYYVGLAFDISLATNLVKFLIK